MSEFQSITLVPPRKPLHGSARVPGSKSITNRVLLLAGLSKGVSRLTGALKSDDTARMAEALQALGVTVEEPDATTFVVRSDGRLKKPADPLFLGNAGTATRFLTAAVALVQGDVTVTGDANMQKRPIRPLIEALVQLGIRAETETGCPPVVVQGTGGFPGTSVTIDASLSSQYVSALLMLAPCGSAPVQVALSGDHIGARGYIDLTTAAMRAFGAKVDDLGGGKWLVHPGGYHATDLFIEPDASAATYLWAAERMTGGKIDIGCASDSFTQPDAAAYAIINQWPRMPAVIDGSQMQDAVPTLAVMAAYNETTVRFVGIANLRVKECDRIAALSQGLNRIRLGLAREDGDDLIVKGDPELSLLHDRCSIHTFDDHRIAMSFALAGLMTAGIQIFDPDCVRKTFPDYWTALSGLGVQTAGGSTDAEREKIRLSALELSEHQRALSSPNRASRVSAGSRAAPSPKAI